MGEAGDAAASRIAASAQKMAAPMREATASMANQSGQFGTMYKSLLGVAGMQMATPNMAGITQMLQALEKARVYYQQIQQEASRAASLGKEGTPAQREMAVGYEQAAAAAKNMATALESVRGVESEMIAEGATVKDQYTTLAEQIKMLDEPMAGLSDKAKQAFTTIESGVDSSKEAAEAMKEASAGVEASLQKEIDAYKQIQAEQAKAAQAEADRQAKQQAKEEAIAAKEREREATKAEAEAEKEAAAAKRETAKADREAAVAAKEHAESQDKLKEMMMGAVGMGAGMMGFTALTEAIEKPISMLKEAMKGGAEEEQLTVKLHSLGGSAVDAMGQLDQLKEFVTGPLGGALKLDDVAQGVRQLELLTGQSKVDEETLSRLGATAQVSGKSFTEVAAQYGKVVDMIRLGAPIRQQLLIGMQQEGLISEATVGKIKQLIKAHADHETIIKALDEGMAHNEEIAKELGDTYESLQARLSKAFEQNILAPLGGMIEDALKGPMRGLVGFFTSPEVKQGMTDFGNQLNLELAKIRETSRNEGPGAGLIEGLGAAWNKFSEFMDWVDGPFGDSIAKAITQAVTKAGTDAVAALKKAWDEFILHVKPPSGPSGITITGTGANVQVTGPTGAAMKPSDVSPELQKEIQLRQQLNDGLSNSEAAQRALEVASNDLKLAQQNQAIVAGNLNSTDQQLVQADTAVAAAQKAYQTALKNFQDEQQKAADSQKVAADDARLLAGNNKEAAESGIKLSDADVLAAASAGTLAGGLNTLAASALATAAAFAVAKSDLGSLIGHAQEDFAKLNAQVRTSTQTEHDSALQQEQYYMSFGKAPPYVPPPGGGGMADFSTAGKGAKDAKGAFKDLDNAIKDIQRDEKIATDEAKLYSAQAKAGSIGIEEAATKTAAAYQDEYNKISQQIPVLEQLQAKYEAMGDKGKEAAQKAADELELLRIKQQEILAQLQQLGTANPFQNFMQGIREATNAWGTFGQQTINLGKQITDQIASGMGNAMAAVIEQTGKLGDAFKQMADAIIKDITDMIAKLMIQWAWESLLSYFGGGSGVAGIASIGQTAVTSSGSAYTPVKFTGQTGGLVAGPGGPDKVPSMLTAGEYVLTQQAVAKYGMQMIEQMNRGVWVKSANYASGGFVGSATSPSNIPPSQNANAANTAQNIAIVTNVTVPGSAGQSAAGATVGGTGGQQGLSTQELAQLQQSISLVVRDEIVRQKRPGGLLSKQQLSI